MGAYEARIDRSVYDAIDREEAERDFIESVTRKLTADDDVIADGLSDALYDPRTRRHILKLYRAGDRLAAMDLMCQHAETTYINEQAELASIKEFH
jgi:DNA-binding GntR family transcriptional regulator